MAGLLPVARTACVGRKQELDRIGGLLLGTTRLVTLIGSGGIGKTTLAEEAVRRLTRERRVSVFWVRLAPLSRDSNASGVEEAVAGAVLPSGFGGPSIWDGMINALTIRSAGRDLQSVLVLDNCEHVLTGVGPVIASLLDEVAGLTIMATSRQPIGWSDEQLVKVPPLSTESSVELFRERAELTGHSIIGPAQLVTVRRICRHLHGHPLYIRLAAARTFYEPLPTILHQLSGDADDMRMRWEHGPRVGTESRHHTISDVIGWSYKLCSDKEKLLFERLSVFAPGYELNPDDANGGATGVGADLEAIQAVCADDISVAVGDDEDNTHSGARVRLERAEIRGLLDRLVEQSLVSAHITATSGRYSLLETLRIFAKERLVDRSTPTIDEPGRLTRRHHLYYRDKISHAQAHWCSPAERELMDWARGAWENIRLAIETSPHAPAAAETGLEIVAGLIALRAPFIAGSLPTARRWAERALESARNQSSDPTPLQITVMAQIAMIALWEGRRDQAERMLDQAVIACIPEPVARYRWRENPQTDIGMLPVIEFVWGLELINVAADPQAITVLARAREKFHALGDSGGEAICSLYEATTAALLGSRQEALEIAERHLEHITRAGAKYAKSWAEVVWAIALLKHRDPAAALPIVRGALRYQVDAGDNWGVIFSLSVYVWALALQIVGLKATSDTDKSQIADLANEIGTIIGGLGPLRTRLEVRDDGLLPPFHQIAITIASDVIGPKAFAAAEKRGSQLRPELNEVQRLVLGTLHSQTVAVGPEATPARSNWCALSAAERDVAILVAAGWANSAIAARRGTSTKTVDSQTSSIFQKLDIISRDEIIRFVPPEAIDRVKNERRHRPLRPGK